MSITQRLSLVFVCAIISLGIVASATVMAAALSSEPREVVNVHLSSDITIQVGDQVKSFFDANGMHVFPLIYQGTTYLPVRAISALMDESIEWDAASRTVFIGRTLTNPGASMPSAGNYARPGYVPYFLRPAVEIVEALKLRDIIIMHNFEVQNFVDVNGNTVYPINFQGSNYLPVRAIAGLMGETIEWDPEQRRIFISAGITETAHPEVRERVQEFDRTLTEVAAIFDRSTARVLSLQNAKTLEQFVALVDSSSADVHAADVIVKNLQNMNTNGFSDLEMTIYNSLFAYAYATARYALITENIVYMAFQGQDFSIFGEVFLTFMMDTQTKFEVARNAIRAFHTM